jgi:septum formation protein
MTYFLAFAKLARKGPRCFTSKHGAMLSRELVNPLNKRGFFSESASVEVLGPSHVVLASASLRRQELLKVVWPHLFMVSPQDINETPLQNEIPADYVKRVTLAKASAAAKMHEQQIVLASDTVVACGRRILRKAADRAEATWQMNLLSGRRHRVLTGVAVIKPRHTKPCYRLAQVHVSVARLRAAQIQRFLDSGEWQGVAVYRLQGLFGSFVKSLRGQPSAVLGLPLYETARLLGVG